MAGLESPCCPSAHELVELCAAHAGRMPAPPLALCTACPCPPPPLCPDSCPVAPTALLLPPLPPPQVLDRLSAPSQEWHRSLQFTYWLQWHLHRQLLQARGCLRGGAGTRGCEGWIAGTVVREMGGGLSTPANAACSRAPPLVSWHEAALLALLD